MNSDIVYLFWTCPNKREAKKIIRDLLDQRLIACASLIANIESIYRWEDKIENAFEVKVILKTVSKHFERIQKRIKKKCSYKVPEIVLLDIHQGNPDYLSWVIQECK